MSISVTSGESVVAEVDGLEPVLRRADDVNPLVEREQGFHHLDEQGLVVHDEDADRVELGLGGGFHGYPLPGMDQAEARERIQKLLVTGDNRLKQGVSPEKARGSYEQALQVAREAGLEESVRPLVELRLADLERLSRESPRSAPPDA